MPLKDPIALKRYKLAWYSRNRDRLLDAEASSYLKSSAEKKLYKAAQSRASKNGIPFNITIEDIVIPDVCPILGTPFVKYTDQAASLDKRDPSLGYVKGNVWVISKMANRMKTNATADQLRKFASWVWNNY